MGGASKFFMLLSTPFPLLCPRPSALRLARHTRVSLACLSSSGQARRFSYSSSSRSGFRINASEQIHTQTSTVRDDYFGESVGVSPNARVSQSWPEWTKLVGNVREGGYFDRRSSLSGEGEAQGFGDEDAFSVVEELPDEFAQAARACLSFARERSELLRLLSRKDIELVVDNGSPFLFKNSVDSARRMRTFLDSSGSDVSENERPHMVDLMRFLLSYAFNPTNAIDRNNLSNRELVESSVRNLLNELAEVSKMGEASRTDQGPNLLGSMPSRFPDRHGQMARPLGQNIEMKRGDWICSKCSFMNFARNMKCLECNEARPKRQLTGGEWECPQCDFFNYGRNAVCLRCDCKRPGGTSFGTRSTLGYSNENFPNKDDTERRLAANEEKAERWFSKVSQVDNGSGLSSSVADEDFPEIMPLRKGVNRFVVSTRKTPLERKLADAQFRRNLGNDGTPEENDTKAGDVGRFGPNRTLNSSISESLDRILGRSSAVSGATSVTNAGESNNEMRKPQMPTSTAYGRSGVNNSGHVPFVPLPADMFAKSQTSKMEGDQVADNSGSIAARANDQASYFSGKNDTAKSGDDMLLSEKPAGQVEGKDIKEQDEKSERWFKKVAELHDVTDLPSAISDEDFPEIMPMRKGENRFVVSKKKDRSLTSPLHKRRMAMEQASNTNFVPFVPFPPDYFAKKDKQPEAGGSSEKVKGETAAATENLPGVYEKSDGNNAGMPEGGVSESFSTSQRYQQTSTDNWNDGFSGRNLGESKMSAGDGPSMETKTKKLNNLETSEREGWAGGSSWKGITNATNSTGSSSQQSENPEKSREAWRGKTLEGSAVKKEPDPLDMSEEAKTERWFRRVAQIKDISELSNIPDEDFPSIMPMRKGVNRFVVSKRKTPLERRLTSPQYRRNLPIVTSDPMKKENDTS